MTTRREFIRTAALGTAAISLGGILPGFSSKSYSNIIGANDRIRVGAIGINSRGRALASNFAKQKGCQITRLCDVDSRALSICASTIEKITGDKVNTDKDLRVMLEQKDIDAVIIATPDHWHAPASLMAMKAGKHVYVEKPCSYTPHEGEMLIIGAKRYNRVVQMGAQRRSWPNVVEGIKEIKAGAIGNPYFGKGWYTNNRPSIGIGKKVEVPKWLDWDLWQGPAPRRAYQDNIVHYNWHWFWNWGTGEALNNGTHMMDILRWGMEVDFPTMVSSVGGRYRYQDDWETPDTQVINWEFGKNKSMSWEGRSCNSRPIDGDAVGVMFYGEKGSLLITGTNGYKIFDPDNKLIKEVKSDIVIDARNLMDPAEQLDAYHIQNFFDGIRKGTKLNTNIIDGHKSTLMMQLGNISQRVGRSLSIDNTNGQIKNDPEAMLFWKRKYDSNWEMKL
jgi:predicted dehydrogenase